MLEARGLCKSFGNVVAVRGVSFCAPACGDCSSGSRVPTAACFASRSA